MPKAVLKAAWRAQTHLRGTQSFCQPVLPWRREGTEPDAGDDLLTTLHGLLLALPLVALHLGAAALFLRHVVAAVVPVAAP